MKGYRKTKKQPRNDYELIQKFSWNVKGLAESCERSSKRDNDTL